MGRGLHSENWKEEKVYYNYPTMKKTTRSFDVDYHLDWSYSVTIEQVNYPPTPEAMGWASWVKAPSNEGNVP